MLIPISVIFSVLLIVVGVLLIKAKGLDGLAAWSLGFGIVGLIALAITIPCVYAYEESRLAQMEVFYLHKNGGEAATYKRFDENDKGLTSLQLYNRDLAHMRRMHRSWAFPGFIVYPNSDHIDFLKAGE